MNYKIVLIVVIAALAAGGVFYAFFMRGTQTPSYATSNEYGVKEQQYIDEEKAKLAALEEEYKNDPYGGSTPEETLQLYIQALEKGDIEMAVNLFAVEDRELALSRLIKTRDNDNLPWFAGVLKNIKGTNDIYCSDLTYECSITFYSEEKEQIHFEKLKQNKFSQKWKIRESENF